MGTLRISAALALGVLTVVFTWWAIKQGAYFGVVMLPGILVLCLGLIVLSLWSPWRGDLVLWRPVSLALSCMLGLAAWSLLSVLWSPSPDVAVADAQRIAGYGVCFALGLRLCNLLGPRMYLGLAPVAIAGGIAGLVAAGALLVGDDITTYLEGDGTLQHPLGYRNANAAFFAIAAWPALELARTRELGWGWRALALGTTTLCFEMVLLSQSRGSVLGIGAALAVYALLARERARALVWLAIALLSALIVIPALSDLYATANDVALIEAVPEMRSAGKAALVGAAVAVLLAMLAMLLERRLRPSAEAERRADRFAGGALIAAVVVGCVAFVVAVGNPIDFFEEQVDEFRTEGSPAFQGQASRFTFSTGTERLDLWGVALEDAGRDPLFGDGAGGFQYSYARSRSNADQSAKDAHSVELEVLSELGLPGLALFGTAIVATVTGALRSRRLGPAAAGIATAALTSGAYWLTHTSIDWFWTYAGVTAPVFMLLGVACGPAILSERQRRGAGRAMDRAWGRRPGAQPDPVLAERAIHEQRVPDLAIRPRPSIRRPRPSPAAQPVRGGAVACRGRDRAGVRRCGA